MSSHGKSDAATNVPFWPLMQFNQTMNTDNRTALFGNTTANTFGTHETVGVFAVDGTEVAAQGGAIAHSGYVLRKVGSGGRAGRVLTEVLVAHGIVTDSEDTVYPDAVITIVTEPAANTVTGPAEATFSVVATVLPTNAVLTYQWQYSNGTNVTENSIFTDTNTAIMVVANTDGLTGDEYKVVISSTGATSVTSANAVLTVE